MMRVWFGTAESELPAGHLGNSSSRQMERAFQRLEETSGPEIQTGQSSASGQ